MFRIEQSIIGLREDLITGKVQLRGVSKKFRE
jgi:hypothetical protein